MSVCEHLPTALPLAICMSYRPSVEQKETNMISEPLAYQNGNAIEISGVSVLLVSNYFTVTLAPYVIHNAHVSFGVLAGEVCLTMLARSEHVTVDVAGEVLVSELVELADYLDEMVKGDVGGISEENPSRSFLFPANDHERGRLTKGSVEIASKTRLGRRALKFKYGVPWVSDVTVVPATYSARNMHKESYGCQGFMHGVLVEESVVDAIRAIRRLCNLVLDVLK